jgi:capsid protein
MEGLDIHRRSTLRVVAAGAAVSEESLARMT